MRRRAEESEERVGVLCAELQQLRVEATHASAGRVEKHQDSSDLIAQLGAAQREAREAVARAGEQRKMMGAALLLEQRRGEGS